MPLWSLKNLLSEKRLEAKVAQMLVGVTDDTIICHGFGRDPRTWAKRRYTLWFKDGKLHRLTQKADSDETLAHCECDFFEARLFHEDVEYWWEDCTHPTLRSLFFTFGNPLPEIVGGVTPTLPNPINHDPIHLM